MTPPQHLAISWVLSNLNWDRCRDRVLTTLVGIVPDIDALGVVFDKFRGDETSLLYQTWHRTFGHNIFAMIILTLTVYFVCQRRSRSAGVAMLIYLVHTLCDLIGSAGVDGSIWPICPFWPISDYELSCSWQWALSDWKNSAIGAFFILIMVLIAVKKNRSPIEMVSTKADKYCLAAVKSIFSR